ncbi:MAG: hypothetical protein M1828_003784 [Chrysothrix sp. TS-e1954]|nr:MAG: hypothetical protein M1828_003784 [Chrysothrix sp. TS-e1954]
MAFWVRTAMTSERQPGASLQDDVPPPSYEASCSHVRPMTPFVLEQEPATRHDSQNTAIQRRPRRRTALGLISSALECVLRPHTCENDRLPRYTTEVLQTRALLPAVLPPPPYVACKEKTPRSARQSTFAHQQTSGPPREFYDATEDMAIAARPFGSLKDVGDTPLSRLVLCTLCQDFHRRLDGSFGRMSLGDSHRMLKTSVSALDLGSSIRFSWPLLRMVMESHRLSLPRGVPLGAVCKPGRFFTNKCWNISIKAAIVQDRLLLKISSELSSCDPKIRHKRRHLAPRCGHLQDCPKFLQACRLIVEESGGEAASETRSALFRCHQCPSEYRFRVSEPGMKAPRKRRVLMYQYIDVGRCETPFEREWKTLTATRTNRLIGPFPLMRSVESRFEGTADEHAETFSHGHIWRWQYRVNDPSRFAPPA